MIVPSGGARNARSDLTANCPPREFSFAQALFRLLGEDVTEPAGWPVRHDAIARRYEKLE